ncbi:stress response translation initiation inhibitor YciH [Candidatus Micrarchaeota archaeon]|nr:stress response translation initiation inhibitor YciH [Candidatus Micrarchaeota archaeon]
MAEICPKCGMIEDLCACEILDKEEVTKIRVYVTKKKFRKLVTVIEGIDKNRVSEAAKSLKQALACGGSAKEGSVVLQGNHKRKVKGILVKLGYPEESIEVE